MSEQHPFEQWWADTQGYRLPSARGPHSSYEARDAWNAAIRLAAEHVLHRGDRRAILGLLVPEMRRNAK